MFARICCKQQWNKLVKVYESDNIRDVLRNTVYSCYLLVNVAQSPRFASPLTQSTTIFVVVYLFVNVFAFNACDDLSMLELMSGRVCTINHMVALM